RPQGRMQRKLRAACLAYLEEAVADPELRAALTPDYPFFCKRPVVTSDFYPALARDNVELVRHAVERITAGGVGDSAGVERAVDVLVMATGFTPSEFLKTLRVRGRDGRSIHDYWAGEARAWLGMAVPGFPNFFIMYGPNTNGGPASFMLQRQ